MQRIKTGILVFEDVEPLDFCGPFEVFCAVRLDEEKRRQEPSPFEIILISPDGKTITSSGGLKIVPDHGFADCPQLDLLVVPGGWGVRREIDNPVILSWLREVALGLKTLASVCTGSMLLGAAGLLSGLEATTHFKSLAWMRESFPDVRVREDLRVVASGKVISSAGIAAGIDMALYLVGEYFGEDLAKATAWHMEYPYPEDFKR